MPNFPLRWGLFCVAATVSSDAIRQKKQTLRSNLVVKSIKCYLKLFACETIPSVLQKNPRLKDESFTIQTRTLLRYKFSIYFR